MSDRIHFSANALIYDQRHGTGLSADEVLRLRTAAKLRPQGIILDVGAGTGRVAVPFAASGFRVVAVEPDSGMSGHLRGKAGGSLPLHVVAAEGGDLPFSNGQFSAVLIARLLYLTPDWFRILQESSRVLVPEGCLLHEWGNGTSAEEWVLIREHARRLFEGAGVDAPFHPGVRSEDEVGEALARLGLVRTAELRVGLGPMMTLREFVRRIADGELSYTWRLPESVRAECLSRLERWAEKTFNLDRPLAVPADIRWSVYEKQKK